MASDFHEQLASLQYENTQLRLSLSSLEEKLEDLECRERRNNLIFHGISGERGETWDQSESNVREFLHDELHVEKANDIVIIRAHRLNPGKSDSPIIDKFLLTKDKSDIFKRGREQQDRNHRSRVTEDFPQKIREDRRALSTYFQEARDSGNDLRYVLTS
ncbi:uncharacterized protein [Haliotis cracherodii]|uniref:uncharacterized protein n=1 Tax=Haliotis cracherodii TaxID=6455 RepID=UPI0039EBB2E9